MMVMSLWKGEQDGLSGSSRSKSQGEEVSWHGTVMTDNVIEVSDG